MKLGDLRLLRQPLRLSNVIQHSGALAGGKATREVAGLTAMLGGALTIAEVMVPRADQTVMVFGDEDRRLQTELLCHECYGSRLADLVEQRSVVKETVLAAAAQTRG